MKKKLLLFYCLIIIQIAVPVWLIANNEITLRYGKQYRFRTAPVDPYDAFRGRYVALTIEQQEIPAPKDAKDVSDSQTLYGHISVDKDGFALLDSSTIKKPARGNDYIRVKIAYLSPNSIRFIFPLNRYYMNEKKAPAAETAYRELNRINQKNDSYILVRVRNGSAVIEDLYVGGKPIIEYIKEKQQAK